MRELRTRADVGDRLLRRLDAAHRRRPVHPRGRDHPASARQHRAPGRRDHGAPRPCVDPGLDGHPDALQHPPRLHPDAACEAPRRPRSFIELNKSPSRLLGEHGRLHREPAQGLLGYRARRPRTTSDSTTCRGSAATTAPTRRRSTCSTARSRLHRRGREPRRRIGERRRFSAGRWLTAKWLVVRDLVEIETAVVLVRLARGRVGRARHERDRDGGLLPAGGLARREGGVVHEHPAAAPVAPQGGRAAWRLPLGALVLLPPRAADPREAGCAGRGRPRPAGAGACMGLPGRPARSTSRRAEAVLREINGWGADGEALSSYTELKDDGSTTCGCWIYCGCYADETNQAARRQEPARAERGSRPSGAGPGPPTGASSTTGPRPIPTGGRGPSASVTSGGTTEHERGRARTCPTSSPTSGPTTARPTARRPQDQIAGHHPFIMQADGRGWLFAPGRASSTARSRRTTSRTSRRSRTRCTRRRPIPPGSSSRAAKPLQPERRRTRRGEYPYVVHDLPADRASHGRRHEPLARRTSPSCSRRCSARSARSWPPSAASSTAAGRRSRTRARCHRGAGRGQRAHAPAVTIGAGPCTRSGFPITGAARADDGGLGQRPAVDRRSTRTSTSRRARSQRATSARADGRAGARAEAAP